MCVGEQNENQPPRKKKQNKNAAQWTLSPDTAKNFSNFTTKPNKSKDRREKSPKNGGHVNENLDLDNDLEDENEESTSIPTLEGKHL